MLSNVRAALDVLSRVAQPQIAALRAAVVSECHGDQEPVFGATVRLLGAVGALAKALSADIPALIDDLEVTLAKTARPVPAESEDNGL
jgi:hypothetical protein